MSRYQKGGTNLDFTEARDSEWQWHQLGQMQVCTLLQTDNHTSIPPLIPLTIAATLWVKLSEMFATVTSQFNDHLGTFS